MSFGTKVEDLIGSVGDNTLITESLQMVGEEIINSAPIEKLNNASITASIPAEGVSVHSKRVLGASKSGYTARLVNPEEESRYLDDDSIYRATDVSPVYYLQADKAFLLATASVATTGTLRYVPKTPTDSGLEQYVSSTSTATYAFPKEAETLMVIGAAARCLQRLMTDIDVPADINIPVTLLPSESLPTFTAPSSFSLPALPADANVDFTNVPTAPVYTKPVLTLPDTPVISDLSITAQSLILPLTPTPPELTKVTYIGASENLDSAIGNVVHSGMSASSVYEGPTPTYNAPVINLTTAPSINWDLPNAPIDPVFDWSSVTQAVSEMVMPAGIVLPSLEISSFPTSDISWSIPSVPVSPIIDWTVVYQTVQDIILPSKIILPALSFGDTPTVTWNFPNAPVQPELSYANITQTVDTINLPAEIVLPSLSIPDAPDVTWNFPGQPVQAPLDWGDLESWITGEDAEMANTRINAVQAQVGSYQGSYSAYGTAVNAIIERNRGTIATWGDEWKTKAQVYAQELSAMVDKFRGESQGKQSIVQAQVAARDSQVREVLQKAQATVNLYQAKVSVYQAEVNGIIQQNIGTIKAWSDEWNAKSQKFAAEIGAKVQKYTAEAGGEAKVSQAQIAVRSQQLQEVQAKAATEVQVYSAKMQAYQIEVATMAQKNKAIAQNWQIEWGTKVQNFGTETNAIVTQYQGEIGGKSKAVQAQVAVLQAQIQKASSENSASLEIYKAQVQGYQTDVNVIIQRNGAQVAAWKQENTMAVQKYQADIQNYMNVFQKENVAYQAAYKESAAEFEVLHRGYEINLQADLQTAIKNKDRESQRQLQNSINTMQAIIQDNQSKVRAYTSNIQAYGAELQRYQSELQKQTLDTKNESQEYVINEIQKELGIWKQDMQGQLSEYSTGIQNETSRVGADMNIYTQELGKALKQFQAESGYDLGKYSAQVQGEAQRFMSDLKKNTDTFRTSLEKYQADLAKTSSINQTKLAKYGADIQEHNARMQKKMADYQWKQSQYQALRGEYMQGLQLFMKRREDVMNLEQKRRR